MGSLTATWQDPKALAEAGRSQSGLDFMRAMIAGTIPPPPIAQLMGFRLVEVDHGHAVFECIPGEQHYNPIGVVHGGLAMTLLDSCMGCCVHTSLPAGTGYTTLEAKVNLVRAITATTGPMRAIGKLVHGGKSIATAEGRLVDAAGKLYAHGTTTCIVLNGR
jgi:uncharacterized protein (TIGR00369 family)